MLRILNFKFVPDIISCLSFYFVKFLCWYCPSVHLSLNKSSLIILIKRRRQKTKSAIFVKNASLRGQNTVLVENVCRQGVKSVLNLFTINWFFSFFFNGLPVSFILLHLLLPNPPFFQNQFSSAWELQNFNSHDHKPFPNPS